MKIVYKARDITEAHIISGLLKSSGISAHVCGHYLQGGVGDLAAMDFETINVADEDADSAKLVITEYENNNANFPKPKIINRSMFTVPLIILSISIIMMLLLAIAFSDYK